MNTICYNERMDSCAKTIYKILSMFEKQLDAEEFDVQYLKPEAWNISETRFYRYLQMLIESEYIAGITVNAGNAGAFYVSIGNPRITLKGIEYLVENSMMQKAFNLIKKSAEICVQKIR